MVQLGEDLPGYGNGGFLVRRAAVGQHGRAYRETRRGFTPADWERSVLPHGRAVPQLSRLDRFRQRLPLTRHRVQLYVVVSEEIVSHADLRKLPPARHSADVAILRLRFQIDQTVRCGNFLVMESAVFCADILLP